ncbi:hypothetical protein SCLCIDRAFT_861566 [Scleroderma citrinum Foug A]|uniref:Zn(2)-C6 fungal-type domain-containing protein n=1 Tax=Scleroderma citrinum Foug A TaxID=1036808 RepID=A0A0C3D2Q3_9AGAM|nr:hypothetical protein SCLCIDRAFT_861566 [Scleroderma citrinum Foug A]
MLLLTVRKFVEKDDSPDQTARIAYPERACSQCEMQNIICTGPTVGCCARCKVAKHGCSNSRVASKGKRSKGEAPTAAQGTAKEITEPPPLLARLTITIPPRRHPLESTAGPSVIPPSSQTKPGVEGLPQDPLVTPADLSIAHPSPTSHPLKRRRTASPSSPCSKVQSPSLPLRALGKNDIDDLRRQMDRLAAYQDKFMGEIYDEDKILMNIARDMQQNIERLASETRDNN